MKIINLGSLNIDKTYQVDHIVKPKETISARRCYAGCGGKGLNQSVALARAGALTYHAGLVGRDGDCLIRTLKEAGVKTDFVRTADGDSGHAIIQLDDSGENSIITCSGANGMVDEAYIDEVLENFGAGDLLLLQNEISHVDHAIVAARKKGMTVAINLSPITGGCFGYHLEDVDFFILNEVEAAALADISWEPSQDPEDLVRAVLAKYPQSRCVVTLGEQGAFYGDGSGICHQAAYRVKPVDTTSAGDTFCGYFLARIAAGGSVETALAEASAASAIAVGRKGASASIPKHSEVEEFLRARRSI